MRTFCEKLKTTTRQPGFRRQPLPTVATLGVVTLKARFIPGMIFAVLMVIGLSVHANDTASDFSKNANTLGTISPALFPENTPYAGDSNLSRQEAQALRKARRQAVRQEAKKLRRKNERQLIRAAERGEITAQLVLAEIYTREANTNALTIGAANAALADALRWYSIAASKGYPGGTPIDQLMPVPPMRVIRGQ